MRIAICTHLSLAYMGGGEREMCELGVELANRGHDVEFYALPFLMGAKRKLDPHEAIGGLPYHEGWTHKVDADVAYTFYHPMSSLNFRATGKKIASFHSQAFFMKSVSPSYGLAPLLASYGTRLIGPLELKSFDAIHSHYPQPLFKNHKIYTIPGWVDTSVFKPTSPKHDEFTVLFSGRALWQKGWDIYVRLANRMRNLGIRFQYVGGAIKDDVIHSLGFQSNMSALSRIYSGSHVLMDPVRADTFGRVAIESMACVPYDTLISSPTAIAKTHSRLYDGDVVVIETEGGKILTLTPNHRVLTTRGWIPGGLIRKEDILVSDDESTLDSARIGDLVEGTRRLHTGTTRGAAWQNGSEHQVSSTDYALPQEALSDEVQILSSYGGRIVVLGRDSRWRRDNNTEEVASWQESTSWSGSIHPDCEHLTSAPGLAEGEVQLSLGARSAVAESSRLHVRAKRLYELLPLAESASTLHGNQALPLQSHAEVRRGAYEVGCEGSTLGRVARVASLYPMAKLETIASIRHETARGIRVYNLTTLGGHYSANGVIVHNCGTPVVTTPSLSHVGLNLPFVFGNTLDEYEASILRVKELWENGQPYRKLSQECSHAAEVFDFNKTVTEYERMFYEVVAS